MFVGHLALAFVAKRAEPEVQLGWFVAATMTLDLVWPVFLLLGIEHVHVQPGATAFSPLEFVSYPWSHALLMSLLWGTLLAGAAISCGQSRRAAMWIFALVVSHWILDVLTHAPDLPLWPGPSPRLGLRLWDSIPGTMIVEGALWSLGILAYVRRRRPRSWGGPVAFWSFAVLCTLMWLAGPWSPPPPSDRFLAWFSLVGWLVLPWTALADSLYQTPARLKHAKLHGRNNVPSIVTPPS
jgi:hypothetical protein